MSLEQPESSPKRPGSSPETIARIERQLQEITDGTRVLARREYTPFPEPQGILGGDTWIGSADTNPFDDQGQSPMIGTKEYPVTPELHAAIEEELARETPSPEVQEIIDHWDEAVAPLIQKIGESDLSPM